LLFVGIWFSCNRQTSQTKAPLETVNTKTEKKESEFETRQYLMNWKIVEHQHPKVSELHIGSLSNKHDKFKIYFDTLQPIPTSKEAIEITKDVLNFKAYNDIRGKETENGFAGNWYHKGIRVEGYYINHKYLYKNKEDRSTKYGSYMYVHIDTTVNFDTTNTVTKQEAIAIAKEKSSPYRLHVTKKKPLPDKRDLTNLLTYKIDSTLICWDEVYNEDCFPKIEVVMGLSSKQNITHVTSYYWAFDILTSEDAQDFSYASGVNGFTGEFYQGSGVSYASATTCTGCYTCNENEVINNDSSCNGNDDTVSSFTNQTIFPLPAETDFGVPTRWNNCITFPSIDNVSLNGTPFRFFSFMYDDFFITALNECNANSGGFCTKNEVFMMTKDNSSYNCEELCAYNAVNSLAEIQNKISDIFIEREVFTNKTDFFNSVGPVSQINIDFASTTTEMGKNTFYNSTINHISVSTALNLSHPDFSYTDLEIIGHEYAHHLTLNFWKITPSAFPNLQFDSDAIIEALADIYSHYFTEKIKGTDNWLFADAVDK